MNLSAMARKQGIATATLATFATVPPVIHSSVASVASVAVADRPASDLEGGKQ